MATCNECKGTFSFFSLDDGLCKECNTKLNPPCSGCGNTFRAGFVVDGLCQECREGNAWEREAKKEQEAELAKKLSKNIMLTTETAHNLDVDTRLGIVASEVIIGLHLGKEVLVGVRDLVGGRSKSLQKTFREGREIAFEELQLQAHKLGADAVVGIDIDYLDIGGGKTTMPMVVVSGTAVKLNACEA